MYIREYLDVSVGLIVECLLKTIRHANLLIRCLEFGDVDRKFHTYRKKESLC